MPRMPGLQLADPQFAGQLSPTEKRTIAQALGENLACMQEVRWPFSGRYNAATNNVEPFDLAHELAWPFPVESDAQLSSIPPTRITHSERVVACLRRLLARAQSYNALATTPEDIAWVEEYIADAQEALNDTFDPCFVMEDYKRANLVVMQQDGRWQVSGVFDLMGAHFGDGEVDLSRQYATYLDEDLQLARVFVQAYLSRKFPRPGFGRRFPVYMLLERVIIWEYFQRRGQRWWPEHWTFRNWAGRYVSIDLLL